MDIEKLQNLLKNYKLAVTEMSNTQTRYDIRNDEETLKVLNLCKYVVSNLETKIIDMYISK